MQKEQIFHVGVKAIIRNLNNDILLLKRTKTGKWDLPGGRVQQGENIIDTLIREVKEETGLTRLENIKPLSFFLTTINIPLDSLQVARLIFYCHTCYIVTEQQIILSQEHNDFLWVTLEKAKDLLPSDYSKMLLDNEIELV